jgi:hypothetical protein
MRFDPMGWWDTVKANRLVATVIVVGSIVAAVGGWTVSAIDSYQKIARYLGFDRSTNLAQKIAYRNAFRLGQNIVVLRSYLVLGDKGSHGREQQFANIAARLSAMNISVDLKSLEFRDAAFGRPYGVYVLGGVIEQKIDTNTSIVFMIGYDLFDLSPSHRSGPPNLPWTRDRFVYHVKDSLLRAQEAGLPRFEVPPDSSNFDAEVQDRRMVYWGIVGKLLFPEKNVPREVGQ